MPLGWSLQVAAVQRLTDGWQAEVHVRPVLRTDDGRRCLVRNHHIEIYRFEHSKLSLVSQAIDSTWDPALGISCIFR